MSWTVYSPCKMSSNELAQASRAHLEFIAALLQEVQAQRASQSTETASAPTLKLE
jgi:hypothetical protein